jgi:5'-3' exonuclease
VLLVDGSAFVFLHANKPNYNTTIQDHMARLLKLYRTDKYVFFLEKSKTNFRLAIGVTNVYKGHREANREKTADYIPYLSEVFEACNKAFNPVIYYGVENDDALSMTAKLYNEGSEYNPIIIGEDSDLLSIQGTHYGLKTNVESSVGFPGTIEIITKENNTKKMISTGLFATYSKILKGAAKENYKGLPGYGTIKVYQLLKDLTTEAEMRQLCFELFVKEFGYREGIKKLNEGFRLCYLLKENNNFILPIIQIYNKNINHETTIKKWKSITKP